MGFAKRRADWRLGRWTAKRALATYLGIPGHLQELARIEIRPAPSGAPQVFLANQAVAVSISISHSAGTAICAVAPAGSEIGCDLEVIEPRSDSFAADYFTAEEQALVARISATDRPRLLTLLWSGKESALKALGVGLRSDTRSVTVNPADALCSQGRDGSMEDTTLRFPPSYGLNRWQPLQVRHTDGQAFNGWWQYTGNLMRTLVAAPPPVPPIFYKNLS
jgi:4'-phosphopantetheinyl transferase